MYELTARRGRPQLPLVRTTGMKEAIRLAATVPVPQGAAIPARKLGLKRHGAGVVNGHDERWRHMHHVVQRLLRERTMALVGKRRVHNVARRQRAGEGAQKQLPMTDCHVAGPQGRKIVSTALADVATVSAPSRSVANAVIW